MTRTSFLASLVVAAGFVASTARADEVLSSTERSATAPRQRLIEDEKMRNTVTAAVRIPWRVATAPVWVPVHAVFNVIYPTAPAGRQYLDFLLAREGDSRYVLFGRSAVCR